MKIRKNFLTIMMGLIVLSACGQEPVDMSAEETLLAEILKITLTASAPTATLAVTDTPTPTETPELGARFLNPTSMLETIYTQSEGWGWKDEEGSRLALLDDIENNYFLSLVYGDNHFQMAVSAFASDWNSEYVYDTFTSMLTDFVPASTRENIMSLVRSHSDLGQIETIIDGFRVLVTLREEEGTRRRLFVFVQERG